MQYPPNAYRPYQAYAAYCPPGETPQTFQEKKQLRRLACGLGIAMACSFALLFFVPLLLTRLAVLCGLYTPGVQAFSGLDPLIYQLLSGLTSCISIVLPFLVVARVLHLDFSTVLPGKKVRPLSFLSLVFVGVLVCMYANYAASQLDTVLRGIGISPNIPAGDYDGNPLVLAVYLISLAVVPALTEEFAFRGVMLGSLRRFGDGFAIFASAFLFGLMHGNIIQSAFAFVVGLITGYALVYSGSIWPSVFIHCGNNLFAGLLDVASHTCSGNEYTLINLVSTIALFVLGFVGLFVLLKRDKTLFSLQKSGSVLSFRQKLQCLFGNAGIVVTLVLLLLEMLLIVVMY